MQVRSNVDYQNVRLDRTNMKRSASLVAAPSESLSFRQPVSCQFCRTRKLKCDRGRPCFNCASRKHECAYESASQREPAYPSLHPSGSQPRGSHVCTQHCSELMKRIQRLERAVFPAGEPGASHYTSPAGSIDPVKTSNSTLPNQDEEQQKISRWLEDLFTPV
ncbi:hypothetical protein BDW60DRAFT_200397 [Aspergillus nidulans var. acristatus]